jgi:hypothetical protein
MPNTLAKKLRLQPDSIIAVLNARESEEAVLGELPGNVAVVDTLDGEFDRIIMFVRNRAELARLAAHATAALQARGLLWACFPKKSSGAQTDLSRDRGWDLLATRGFSDVAQISLDEIWSALAFRRNSSGTRGRKALSRTRTKTTTRSVNRRSKKAIAPPDLRRALGRGTAAARNFRSAPFSHKKKFILWILQAKQPGTRARRIAETVRRLSRINRNPRTQGP